MGPDWQTVLDLGMQLVLPQGDTELNSKARLAAVRVTVDCCLCGAHSATGRRSKYDSRKEKTVVNCQVRRGRESGELTSERQRQAGIEASLLTEIWVDFCHFMGTNISYSLI